MLEGARDGPHSDPTVALLPVLQMRKDYHRPDLVRRNRSLLSMFAVLMLGLPHKWKNNISPKESWVFGAFDRNRKSLCSKQARRGVPVRLWQIFLESLPVSKNKYKKNKIQGNIWVWSCNMDLLCLQERTVQVATSFSLLLLQVCRIFEGKA